jgi:hypothetical protein
MQCKALLTWRFFAGVLIVLPVAGVCLSFFTTGPSLKNLYHGKQLATGCQLYAVDHGGRYPVHLSELEPDYIVDVKELRGIIYDFYGRPQYRYDWLYFGAGFTTDNPPTLLLASPQVVVKSAKSQKRLVMHGDTTHDVIDEGEFEKLLAETVRQMRALDDSLHPAKPASGGSPAK